MIVLLANAGERCPPSDEPDMRLLDCPDKLDNYKRLVQYIEQ
jgi:hypothetical protein